MASTESRQKCFERWRQLVNEGNTYGDTSLTSPAPLQSPSLDIYPLVSPTPSEEEALADESTALPSPTTSEEELLAPVRGQWLPAPYLTLSNPADLPPWPIPYNAQEDQDVERRRYRIDSWEKDSSESSTRSRSRSLRSVSRHRRNAGLDSHDPYEFRRVSTESWDRDVPLRNTLSLEEELNELDVSETLQSPEKEHLAVSENAFVEESSPFSDSRDVDFAGEERKEGELALEPLNLLQPRDGFHTNDNGESMDFLSQFPAPPQSQTDDQSHQRGVSPEWDDFLSNLPDDREGPAENGNIDPASPPKRSPSARPLSRHGSIAGEHGAPEFTSRFPPADTFPGLRRGLEQFANFKEDGTKPQGESGKGKELDAEVHDSHLDYYLMSVRADITAPQPRFDSYMNQFSSHMNTGFQSESEDDSGSEHSNKGNPEINDDDEEEEPDSRSTQSKSKVNKTLTAERERLRKELDKDEANKSKLDFLQPLSLEQGLGDGSVPIVNLPKPELPLHLREPENPDVWWDRDNLDLNGRDEMGRIPDGFATGSEDGGWAEPPVDPSTDYDQLRNAYQLNGVQEDGYSHLRYLNDQIESAYQAIDEADARLKSIQEEGHVELESLKQDFAKVLDERNSADARLLALIEQRRIELDRKRDTGIGIAKRKVLMDLDRGRRGFLQRAKGMEKSSAFGLDGKITIPSLEYAMFSPDGFQPTPRIVQTLEKLEWKIKTTKEQLGDVSDKLQTSEQEIESLNRDLDRVELERNEAIGLANERTEAANGYHERLMEEREKTARLTADLEAEKIRVKSLQDEQLELQEALEKSSKEREKLLSDANHLQSSRELPSKASVTTSEDVEIVKEALIRADNAIKNAETDLFLHDERRDELIQKLTRQASEEQQDTLLQRQMASPQGEELRWYKEKVRGLERDLIHVHNQSKDYESELAGNKAKIESIKMESRATIDSLKLRIEETNADQPALKLDQTPIATAKFQLDDQTFNSAVENRNLARELADKEKRVQELESQARDLSRSTKVKQITLEQTVAQNKALQGDIIWLNHNRPNPYIGLPTLPSQLTPLKSDIKADQTTVPMASAEDGIDYTGIERDPIKREEKYRKIRIAKALELQKKFALERIEVKEGEERLRQLGIKIRDRADDNDFIERLFERSRPWERESEPILRSSLPRYHDNVEEMVR